MSCGGGAVDGVTWHGGWGRKKVRVEGERTDGAEVRGGAAPRGVRRGVMGRRGRVSAVAAAKSTCHGLRATSYELRARPGRHLLVREPWGPGAPLGVV